MRRAGFAVVWFIVFYFVVTFFAGVFVGMSNARHHSGSMTSEEAHRVAEKLATDYGIWFLATAGMLTAIGSGAGILPGTRRSCQEPLVAGNHES